MAVPKQRQNSSRRNRRRKHNEGKAVTVTLQKCPSCDAPTQPHRVCTSCGTYKKRQYRNVVETVGA